MKIMSTSSDEIERVQRQEDVDCGRFLPDARNQVASALAAKVIERQAQQSAHRWWCAGQRRCALDTSARM